MSFIDDPEPPGLVIVPVAPQGTAAFERRKALF